MIAELCRDVAFEAARRSERGLNPHELWAVLDDLAESSPSLIVDLWSDPAVVWAWWALGARVVGLAPFAHLARPFGGSLPTAVTEIVGDPKDMGIQRRVGDQCVIGGADVLVLGGPNTQPGLRMDWAAFTPFMRPYGDVVVHGIGNPKWPGVAAFWREVQGPIREYVGEESPDGYGLVRVHGKDRLSHG